ncbi:MAG: alpha/beta hydrolase [Burkholderiales bacterium]|nr:alpha/beta hydrolase [Burkholderiales bacterium]
MTIHWLAARGRALLFAMLLPMGNPAGVAAEESTVSAATHWVPRGDYRLHVWEKYVGSPAGKPVVVLAHGSATAGKESFDLAVPGRKDYSLMDRFARAGFDVFALDVHGFGRSTHPEGYVTTEGAAEDLDAVVDAVRRERGVARVHVIAWSWATQYAGLFVSAHGDKVDRYVSYAQMHADSPDIVRRRADLELYRSRPWIVVPRDGWKARFRSLTPTEVTEPDAMEAFADAAAAIETRTSTGPQLDMVTRLPMVDPTRIAVPTLMIHGQYDDVADTAGLLPFFVRLPNPDKRYVVIPRAGHMMHLQVGRRAFFDAVMDFLMADAPR